MNYDNIPLHLNETEQRFEMMVDDKTAFIDYKKAGNKMFLVHTEVEPELEGKGAAAALVEKTFQYLNEHKLRIIPKCSYVQRYLQKHPEWNKLTIAED